MTPAESVLTRFDVPVPPPVQGRPVILASSGGADSLGALRILHHWMQCGKIPALSVVSINHQIHPDAASWSERACAQAAALGVPATVMTVALPAVTEQGHHSLEARAREARYAALAEALAASPSSVLVTAHHQQDQAETVLLALLRGSGSAGLAAMPVCALFAGSWHWRPFLSLAQADLRGLAAEFPVVVVEDPSNLDTACDRNYLRHEVLPLLQRRWPTAVTQLAQTAEVVAEERFALQESALRIFPEILTAQALPLGVLQGVSRPAQASLLRVWIQAQGALMPPRSRLMEFLRQIHAARPDRQPVLQWGRWMIQRDRGLLHWVAEMPPAETPHETLDWPDPQQPIPLPTGVRWVLRPATSEDTEIIAEDCLSRSWRIRPWRSADLLRVTAGARRRIKTLFQSRGVPVRDRRQYLLIEIDAVPVWVPGLALDMHYRGTAGHGWALHIERGA
ncbi:tRNA lysidine(34) synthetase TilS [Halothiobacillus sp. DCM-1]|uniref:tRNA lysidine(34) synthetase TilS n=1 Tax=Halothiobacillus sp. DCM-1 TaxID=3112558 RepID=UPI0032476E6C